MVLITLKMSIQANFSSPMEIEVVEYPGKVVNIEKMLNTFGGLNKISQVFGGQKKSLELRYHPSNPYNKLVVCEPVNQKGFLLSVKIRRSKYHSEKPPKIIITIVANVARIFRFENLCDYQYLPLVRPETPENAFLTFPKHLLIPESVTDTTILNCMEAPQFFLPNVFARSDLVQIICSRIEPFDNGQLDALGVVQKTMYDNRDVVTFNMNDSFPREPDKQILKRMKVKYVSDEQFMEVKKLFDKCPIWTRIALLYETGITNDKLKCITPSMAYYFSTGPWRTLFVRYGYDPRKDFNSRYFQTFDFRLRLRSGVSEFFSKLSAERKNNRIKDDPKGTKNTNSKVEFDDEEKDGNGLFSLAQNLNYPYLEEDKLPRSKQCILRYCDIHLQKIQEMLVKIPSPQTGATCNEKTGWLPSGFDNQVRHIISTNIREILRKYYRTFKKDNKLKVQMVTENINYEDDEQMDIDVEEADLSDDDCLEDNFKYLMADI